MFQRWPVPVMTFLLSISTVWSATGGVAQAATITAQIIEPGPSFFSWGFAPNPLTVSAGETVVWTNTGAAAHTVTADDGTSFDSGSMAKGATFAFTARVPGTYAYHCSIHRAMQATLVVRPAAAPIPTATTRPSPVPTAPPTRAPIAPSPTTAIAPAANPARAATATTVPATLPTMRPTAAPVDVATTAATVATVAVPTAMPIADSPTATAILDSPTATTMPDSPTVAPTTTQLAATSTPSPTPDAVVATPTASTPAPNSSLPIAGGIAVGVGLAVIAGLALRGRSG